MSGARGPSPARGELDRTSIFRGQAQMSLAPVPPVTRAKPAILTFAVVRPLQARAVDQQVQVTGYEEERKLNGDPCTGLRSPSVL
jgi:hypothetical protein